MSTQPQQFLRKAYHWLRDHPIYVVLFVLIALITIKEPQFFSWINVKNILLASSSRVVIALGVAFVLVSGGVDLSVGRVVGLSAVITASLLQNATYPRPFYPGLAQLPFLLPILGALCIGSLIGLLNGFFVASLRVPPFIATLGSMVITYGLNLIYFDLPPNRSQPIGGLREDLTYLGSGSLGSVPVISLIALGCICGAWVLLNKTVLGKNLYAIGGNQEAAKVAGVNVRKTLLAVYALSGCLASLAGVLEAARSGGAKSNYGDMYELDAIAACVVGGVSTTGGIGTIPGVVAGVLIFAVINYGLTFIGMDPNLQYIVKGLIILFAVALDTRKYLKRT